MGREFNSKNIPGSLKLNGYPSFPPKPEKTLKI
jgi:hypothetical protein